MINRTAMKNQPKGGFLIAKIHQIAGRVFSRKLKEFKIHEINPAQGRIMFVLWRNYGISINELAKKTSLGKSTLTSMLDRLEQSGHIKRVPSKEDRRKILIECTEKDKAMQDDYVKVSAEMSGLFYNGFTKKEIDECEDYLVRILDNLVSIE